MKTFKKENKHFFTIAGWDRGYDKTPNRSFWSVRFGYSLKPAERAHNPKVGSIASLVIETKGSNPSPANLNTFLFVLFALSHSSSFLICLGCLNFIILRILIRY